MENLNDPALIYTEFDFKTFKGFAEAAAQFALTQNSATQQYFRHILGQVLIAALPHINDSATMGEMLTWYQNYGKTHDNDQIFKLMTTPTSLVTAFFTRMAGSPTETDKQIGAALKTAAERVGLSIDEATSAAGDRSRTIYTVGALVAAAGAGAR